MSEFIQNTKTMASADSFVVRSGSWSAFTRSVSANVGSGYPAGMNTDRAKSGTFDLLFDKPTDWEKSDI